MKRFIGLCAVLCLLLSAQAGMAKEIKVGLLSDLTGGTASVGAPYAEGVKACAAWLNAKNYIPGHTIKLLQVDYAYDVQQALAAYKRFLSEGIVALQGWGTGDTEALTKFVGKDRIPTWSASYSAHLTDPAKAPYNFFVATDYSTQARAAFKYLKDNWKEKRAPRLGLVYPDVPYGLSPIPAIKAYAKELGYELVGEEVVGLKAIDATPQLLSLQGKNPDFVWVGGTTPSTAVVMKDAKKLNMNVVFVANIWGSDENLFKLAGDAAKGNIGLQTSVVYGDDVPGMKVIKEASGGQPQMSHYIRGFVSMYVMAEAIRMAAEKGEVTGPAIKAAAESMRDFNTMGLTAPISYYPDDHRCNMSVNLYRLGDGVMQFLGSETLERKKEWLGN